MPDAWFDDESVERLCDDIEYRLLIMKDDYDHKRYGDEPDLSSIFTTRLREAVEGFKLRYKPEYAYTPMPPAERFARLQAREYGLQGRSLTHGNQFGEEIKYGADILLVFEAQVDGEARRKGMLIQTKDNKGSAFGYTANQDLAVQCNKMAEVTDSSYVLIFASNGFHLGLNPIVGNPFGPFQFEAPPTNSLREILKEFFECTGGDPGITTTQKGDFDLVADRLIAQRTLRIKAIPK